MLRRTSTLAVAGLAGALALLGAGPAAAAERVTVQAAEVEVYGPDAPVYPGCGADLPPYSDCGYVDVELTLSGFDAFGGISDCESGADTGSARMHAAVTCGDDPQVHVVKTTLPVKAVSRYFQSSVNSYTRIDSDSALVSAWFEFPQPADYGVCGDEDTTLLRAKVFSISIGFQGAGGAPDATWSVAGARYDA